MTESDAIKHAASAANKPDSKSLEMAERWIAEKIETTGETVFNEEKGHALRIFNTETLAKQIDWIIKNAPHNFRTSLDAFRKEFLTMDWKKFFHDSNAVARRIVHQMPAQDAIAGIEKAALNIPAWHDKLSQNLGEKMRSNFADPGTSFLRTMACYIGGFAILDGVIGLLSPKKTEAVKDGQLVQDSGPSIRKNLAQLAIGSGTVAAALFLTVGGKGHIR